MAGCATPSPTPFLEPGPPPPGQGSIVFAGVDGNLYVAELGRGEILALTDDATEEDSAGDENRSYSGYVWVGAEVVYAAQIRDRVGSVRTAFYSQRPGARRRELASVEDFSAFYLYATPDESRVSFLGGTVNPELLMGSISVNDGGYVEHGRGQPYYWSWAPDGQSSVTHVGSPRSDAGSRLRVDRFSAGGEPEGGEAVARAPGFFQAPAFAPNGRGAAVVLRIDDQQGIYLLSPGGEIAGPVAATRGVVLLGWSPAGDLLAHIDGRYLPTGGVTGSLTVTDLRSGARRQLSSSASVVAWSPDGSKLAFFEPFIASAGGIQTLGFELSVYNAITGQTGSVTRFIPSAAWVQQILPFADQYARSSTIWDPTGSSIVISAIGPDGVPTVYVVDAESGRLDTTVSIAYQDEPDTDGIGPRGGRFRAIAHGQVPFFSFE